MEEIEQPLAPSSTSLIQSLLLEEKHDEQKLKKKKIKTARQKELERLTKVTKTIFNTPEQLNIVCERINALLSNHKTMLLTICRSFDKSHSSRLSYEQFRLIIRDRLSNMSSEDLFVLMKLFEIDGLVDYPAILDEKLGKGILQHIVPLPVPQSNEIQQTSFKYVTLHLRLITFDSYNSYSGHIHLTVPDYMSIYGLSKMIIDKTDLATRSISIFRDKILSRTTLLDPMSTLENNRYTGDFINGTYNQSFPIYTLYYDYISMDVGGDCPILKCDYYMISS